MLTQKQENFCLNLIKGMSQREAYIKAGYSTNNMLPATVDEEACRLTNSPKISTRLEELRKPLIDNAIASAAERKKILTDIARSLPEDIIELNEDETEAKIKRKALKSPAVTHIRTEKLGGIKVTKIGLTDKIRAIAELNKMEGDYAPEKHRIEVDKVESFVFILPDGQRVSPKQLIEGDKVAQLSTQTPHLGTQESINVDNQT